MTRRCIICKETNYKTSYSFFSAPKDPETRKKWANVMGVENFTATDDIYVCSKHFTSSDIITHWVSGVPPHVVTIKYKKCRLRPGAVPSMSCEETADPSKSKEDDCEEFAVNRCSGVLKRPSLATSASSSRDTFLIPREENFGASNVPMAQSSAEDEERATCHTIVPCKQVEPNARCTVVRGANEHDAFSEDTNNSSALIVENPDPEQEMAEIVHIRNEEKFVYAASHEAGETRIIYVEAETLQAMDEEEEAAAEAGAESLGQTVRSVAAEEDYSLAKSHATSAENDTSMDMWDDLSPENLAPMYDNCREQHDDLDCREKPHDTEINDPLAIKLDYHAQAMLFEDLLDVHTEIQLPVGWSPIVTSKGHATTVVYAFMAFTKTGMPYVEKQVFLKSDMKLRCGAADKEINPQIHNLVREGRSRTVCSLADVEEFVEEFDQRTVCAGCASEKTRPEETANSAAYRDVGSKWRHIQCPIIVNNGSSRCSKCSTLDASMKHRTRARRRESAEHALHRSLRKMSRKNERYETRDSAETKFEALASPELFMTCVESLEVPRIQKLMMKECLRASLARNGKSKYSETWVFLCLLLYIESPRMYKYMLANKYMILPSLRIIRKYLHQIKTDKQFYSLFQRTVEPFQPSERDSEKEPT